MYLTVIIGKFITEMRLHNGFSPIFLTSTFLELKFVFSKKATKIDEIFTVNSTLTT